MRRNVAMDRARRIVERAVREMRRGAEGATIATGDGSGGGGGNAGTVPIQDPDGNLLFMCGVSECGGPDVCGG